MKQKISTLLISLAFASVASAEYYTDGGTFVSSSKLTDTLSFQNIVDNYQGTDVNPVKFSIEQQDNSYIANYTKDFEFKGDLIIENNNKGNWNQSAYFVYSATGATITLNKISYSQTSTSTGYTTRYGFKGLGDNHVNIIFNQLPTHPANGQFWLDGATATFKVGGTHSTDTFTYSGSILRAENVNLAFGNVRLRGGNADGACTYKGDTQFELGTKKGIRVDVGFAVNGGSLSVNVMHEDQLGYYEADRKDYLHVITVSYENQAVAESITLKTLNRVFTGSPVLASTGRSGYVDFLDITTMDKGDVFYSELDLTSDAYASKIFINNKNILEYAAEELDIVKDGNFYAYTMNIPEPSTYAMIFGALALGFVAYRRRK